MLKNFLKCLKVFVDVLPAHLQGEAQSQPVHVGELERFCHGFWWHSLDPALLNKAWERLKV